MTTVLDSANLDQKVSVHGWVGAKEWVAPQVWGAGGRGKS